MDKLNCVILQLSYDKENLSNLKWTGQKWYNRGRKLGLRYQHYVYYNGASYRGKIHFPFYKHVENLITMFVSNSIILNFNNFPLRKLQNIFKTE